MGGVYEIERSLFYRQLTREDWMTICLASCLPVFQLHSQTLPQTSGWILHTNSLLSTTDGLNGFLLKKKEKKSVESEHQSTARPHQSAEFALESAAFHIKVTHPHC